MFYEKKTEFVIWLVPSKKDQQQLNEIIVNLSNLYDAPRFTPHLTVVKGSSHDINNVINKINNLQMEDIKLYSLGVFFEEALFKSLFIRLKNTSKLNNILTDIEEIVDKKNIYINDPHLSLLYKKISRDEKQHLSVVLNEIIRQITFSKAVVIVSEDENWGNIRKWKIC